MNDLISRAAAIEAFDDERVDRNYGDVSPESVIKVIESIPTIDAIPVEWLMKVLAEANEFPISERETIVAIPYLVKHWKKEQEAR